MAATTYTTLPSNTYVGYPSNFNNYRSDNYETYGSNIESLSSHPPQGLYGGRPALIHPAMPLPPQQPGQYPPNTRYDPASTTFINPQNPAKTNERPLATNQHTNGNQNAVNTTQTTIPQPKGAQAQNSQHGPPTIRPQNQTNLTPAKYDNSNPVPSLRIQKQKPPGATSNHPRADPAARDRNSTPPPPVRRASIANGDHHNIVDSNKGINPTVHDMKTNKSSLMRAAAIKKLEQKREQKRMDAFFPTSDNKAMLNKLRPPRTSSETDDDRSEKPKKKAGRSQSRPRNDDTHSDYEKAHSKGHPVHSVPTTRKTNHHVDAERNEHEKNKSNKKKPNSVPKTRKATTQSDGDESEVEKSKSRAKPKQHRSRRDDHVSDRDQSSDDDDDNHRRQRSKSRKSNKHDPHFPPIRRPRPGMIPPPGYHPRYHPFYDDYLGYGPYPPPGYRPRHLYEDAPDVPPYLAPYHDPYDPFFDFEKRKAQAARRKEKNRSRTDHEDNDSDRDDDNKSQHSRKSRNTHKQKQNGRKSQPADDDPRRMIPPDPYYHGPYDGHEVLDLWRQERNDYLKKKFKPTIHDVLYSQQWMKADSYAENQRRRHLRDAQGYFFPYKKYTLKDYKDLQKTNNQNPFAEVNEPVIDRKEKAKKRQEYGLLIERQIADNPGTRQVPPRDQPPKQPWHLSNVPVHNPGDESKRERALEYAKEQVKYRPVNDSREENHEPESSRYQDNRHPPRMNGNEEELYNNGQRNRNNQSYDDYYG